MLGLLSKTVTATLPGGAAGDLLVAAGAVVVEDGRVAAVRRFLSLGAAAGVHGLGRAELIGAEGAQFAFTLVERGADRRAGDLVLPGQALLARRTWSSSIRVGRSARACGGSTCFPLAAAVLLLALWRLRRRTRAPLAALLFFVRNALPGVGFSQRVSVHLFVRGRPFPIPGEPGDHHVVLGRRGIAAGACGGLGRG